MLPLLGLDFPIVGTFYRDYKSKAVLNQSPDYSLLVLAPDPNNDYDPNAYKVILAPDKFNRYWVGYVPKELTLKLRHRHSVVFALLEYDARCPENRQFWILPFMHVDPNKIDSKASAFYAQQDEIVATILYLRQTRNEGKEDEYKD